MPSTVPPCRSGRYNHVRSWGRCLIFWPGGTRYASWRTCHPPACSKMPTSACRTRRRTRCCCEDDDGAATGRCGGSDVKIAAPVGLGGIAAVGGRRRGMPAIGGSRTRPIGTRGIRNTTDRRRRRGARIRDLGSWFRGGGEVGGRRGKC